MDEASPQEQDENEVYRQTRSGLRGQLGVRSGDCSRSEWVAPFPGGSLCKETQDASCEPL